MTVHVLNNASALLMPTCLVAALFAGCEPATPVDPAVLATQIEEVRRATPLAITPEEVAATLALGTDATAVQRQRLREQLLGAVVEWDLTVYEVSLSDGAYRVSSRAIPVANSTALDTVSVHATVAAGSDAERAKLEGLRTDDVVRLRGRIGDVLLRSVIVLVPAVVVEASSESQESTA